VIWKAAVAVPAGQVTVAVAVPAAVRVPIFHDQETEPLAVVVAGPSPDAVLVAPLGRVTSRVQVTSGVVCAVSDS